MYRLSEALAKEVMSKIKTPEIESLGPNTFLPKNLNSIGIADPICCVGASYHFLLESPVPIIYPELPFIPVGIQGYFLYKKEELLQPIEPWEVAECFVNPTCTDPEKRIDCREAAIILGSDIDKLVAPTISTMEQLVSKVPLILDCLDLSRKTK